MAFEFDVPLPKKFLTKPIKTEDLIGLIEKELKKQFPTGVIEPKIRTVCLTGNCKDRYQDK